METFSYRSFLLNPAMSTIKTFVGRPLDPDIITPTHLLLNRFANLILNKLSDEDLLVLCLVY